MSKTSTNTNALQEMDKMPLGRALVKNIIPATLAMLMMLVYNLADKIFIGMANNDYMVAAVTLITPIFLIFMAAGNIFGTGGVALMSQLAGEGNHKKIDKVSSFCFWSALMIGILVGAVLFIFRSPLIVALGAQGAETTGFARDYLTYVAISAPFAILSPVLSNLLRAEGKPTLSMMGSVIGNIVNIILDAVFILGFGMGTKGAAIATLIGNAVAVLLYVLMIVMKKSNISIHPADFSGREKIASRVYAIGVTAAIATVGQSLCQILMNNLMSQYGDLPVAGIGAAYNIVTIVMVFALGIGQGCQPLLGFQVGNQNKEKFKHILKYCFITLVVVCLVLTGICYLLMPSIISVFVTGAEAVSYGITFGKIFVSTAWLYGVFQVAAIIIQVMGKAGAALVVNLSKNAYVFIPVLYLSAAVGGMNGIAWAMPLSDVISAIIAVAVMAHTMKKCFSAGTTGQPSIDEGGIAAVEVLPGNKAFIITIGRSYGAGGRSVGKLVAEKLGVPFYDKKIIETAAEESGLSREYLSQHDEKAAMPDASGVAGYKGLFTSDQALSSTQSTAYKAQKSAVEHIAAQGSCVIVGRRADQLLQGKYSLFNIFISAPVEERIKHIMQREGVSRTEAEQKIRRVDRERQQYYESLGDKRWGRAESYDLCIDTGALGVDGAAEVVLAAIEKKFSLH